MEQLNFRTDQHKDLEKIVQDIKQKIPYTEGFSVSRLVRKFIREGIKKYWKEGL